MDITQKNNQNTSPALNEQQQQQQQQQPVPSACCLPIWWNIFGDPYIQQDPLLWHGPPWHLIVRQEDHVPR